MSRPVQNKDQLYSHPMEQVKAFSFDDTVANVFDDMISRSVPQYKDTQNLTLALCNALATDSTCIYDLGCASGTTLRLLADGLTSFSGRIVGVDDSAAMLNKCKAKLHAAEGRLKVELVESKIEKLTFEPASVIILNYTLQFIPVPLRLLLLKKCFTALVKGGALLLSEKVVHASPKIQQLIYDLHHEFKRANGYSELEIAQKRDAIESVLIPLTAEENMNLLIQAGFREVEIYSKSYNFVSIVALKAN